MLTIYLKKKNVFKNIIQEKKSYRLQNSPKILHEIVVSYCKNYQLKIKKKKLVVSDPNLMISTDET